MRIDSIRMENYRCYADSTVDFRPGFNVIVGVNGSGKTSLLNAICEALNGVLGHMQVPGMSSLQDERAVRLVMTEVQKRIRFEPQYPVKITAHGDAEGVAINWYVGKASQASDPFVRGMKPDVPRTLASYLHRSHQGRVLPLVTFYRADRHWNPEAAGELQAATQRNARADGYANWWNASLDADALMMWVIAKHLERLEALSEGSDPPESSADDELARLNGALADAVEGIEGLRYDLKKKSVLVDWHSDAPIRDSTPFENLSDGQKAVIGLVADIARRMCLLNPHLGQDATRKTDGVVLIDELDVHLHPHWQRILTKGLKKAFPSVQFIVASHSPQVLGELTPEEIIVLRPEGAAHPQVSYGLDSSRVLEEIMGTSSRTAEVEAALSDLFTALERNELGSARSMLKRLQDTAPGIAELAGAEALLKRKEVLGR